MRAASVQTLSRPLDQKVCACINMEPSTRPLEIVCKHFKAEFGEQVITNLRKRLQTSYSRTSRANRKVQALSMQLRCERKLRDALTVLLAKTLGQVDDLLDSLQARSLEE